MGRVTHQEDLRKKRKKREENKTNKTVKVICDILIMRAWRLLIKHTNVSSVAAMASMERAFQCLLVAGINILPVLYSVQL